MRPLILPALFALLCGCAHARPSGEWWRGKVFYEVFVRSFQDSGADGKGDLKGLTERLDYLNDGDPDTYGDLGVNALWLMPIQGSPSYHGYDVTDYEAVNPDYGSLADFDRFIEEAHKRGIRVIVDFVLNHTSVEHPWFRSAREGPGAPYRDRYIWRKADPGWTQPWGKDPVWHEADGWYYYAIFWKGMPDLDLSDPGVESDMLGAMRFWLRRGVDGFRVDAVRYLFESQDGGLSDLPETHEFLRRLRRKIGREFPDALLLGEIWADLGAVAGYQGKELHMAFGFDTAEAIKNSLARGTRGELDEVLSKAEKDYDDRGFEAPFISNHDTGRAAVKLDPASLRAAAALLLAMPGTPFLYYGQELGMKGGVGRDEEKRTPMRWTGKAPGFGFTEGKPWSGMPEAAGVDAADELKDPGSLLSLYRRLIRLRKYSPALSEGGAVRPEVRGGPGVWALLREHGGDKVLFVVNVSGEPAKDIRIGVPGEPKVRVSEGLAGGVRSSEGGLVLDGMKGRAFAYIGIKR